MAPVEGDSLDNKMYRLLKKMMLRGHWGPFEHPQITVGFSCSRATMAQITRHRLISFDVQSMRYVTMANNNNFLVPTGTDETSSLYESSYHFAKQYYNLLLDSGVPKEDARMVLPIGTVVNIVASMNARTALHIISMRGAGDAQWEIRGIADGLAAVMRDWMPVTMDIWDNNKMALERQRLSP